MTGTSRISEARTQSRPLATPKESVRVGCWNVRTMFSVGKTAKIVKEGRRYKLRILGISECRWSGFGSLQTATGETILFSGRDDDVHQSGVALLVDKATARSLIEWNPFNDSTHNILRQRSCKFMPLPTTLNLRQKMTSTTNCNRC